MPDETTPPPDGPAGDGASPADEIVPMTEVAPEAVDPAAAKVVQKKVKEKATKKEVRNAYDDLGTKRGVETMFRTAYRVNMDLSSLADAKANIMISINGLIISILISGISSRIDSNPYLLIPATIFLVGCLASIIFAVLAARPRVQTETVTLQQVRNRSANLLFFGNFAHLSRHEFVEGMRELMVDSRGLYESMMLDIYGVGSVLQKKYTLLRWSYTLFMIALVTGVLGFIAGMVYGAVTPDVNPTYTTPGAAAPATALPSAADPGGLLGN
ncbi:MAG: Pycsar system effector family protein [Bacteroidota bacterium]